MIYFVPSIFQAMKQSICS